MADQLREAIVTGSLRPGDRLPIEPELSTIFGVSRSTIREALRLLSSQDLVSTSRGINGGTFVMAADPAKLREYLTTRLGLLSGAQVISVRELLEAREMFEVPAARLAARLRSEDELDELTACVTEESALAERGGDFEPHRAFHSLVLKAARNQLLPLTVEPIFQVLRTRFLRPPAPAQFWRETAHDHAQILRHIRSGDEEGAAVAMRQHLDRLARTYVDLHVEPAVDPLTALSSRPAGGRPFS
ncbi:FadR/GntR family transcriptional regulator [Polymorphospora sp. NPDC050346]|uniref:FadR/GntR family transcriptional regulator n=1 Tax=Polymorphospora sp. NPDC050346 TaxID=3155780 RepID=UPI0033DC4591